MQEDQYHLLKKKMLTISLPIQSISDSLHKLQFQIEQSNAGNQGIVDKTHELVIRVHWSVFHKRNQDIYVHSGILVLF